MHKYIFQPRLNRFDAAALNVFWVASVYGVPLWVTLLPLLFGVVFSTRMERRCM